MSAPQTLQPNGDQVRRKRDFQGGPAPKRQKTQKKPKPVKEGGHEEVLLEDVRALFAAQKRAVNFQEVTSLPNEDEPAKQEELPALFTEIEVKVLELSSTGDGLAIAPSSDQIYVVPFTAPGDKARIKVIRHNRDDHYTIADFLEVIEPSPLRDDKRINCQYFAKCSGCQFQMMDYAEQLKHKRSIVEKAYKNFSGLSPDLVPSVRDTMGSPLQYGYRTKLTPHFDGPSRSRGHKKVQPAWDRVPEIGFMQKGIRKTLDIEDCPIGTDAVRMGMKRERKRIVQELDKYKRGATILLRESTERIPKSNGVDGINDRLTTDMIEVSTDTYTDLKTCITDNNATSTEYINSYMLTNPAGAFFQNNNSILPPFTQYIREVIIPSQSGSAEIPRIKFLIDAYSGSGLFTITLSSLFESSTGIDISGASIEYARKNAELNHIPSARASFIAADAPELFKSVKYPPDETVVVIDPPRKGCDESFLNQLLKFAPKRVVYVSCNVHTQARDVGILVNGKKGVAYTIESLRGFDFFPQTGHVEGVAVLERVDKAALDLKDAQQIQ